MRAILFTDVVGWDMDTMNVAWSRELEPTEVLMASGGFYPLLGVNAAIGRTFGDLYLSRGRSAPLAIEVAIALAVSWKPLVKSNTSAVRTTAITTVDMGSSSSR